jgi:hypothetical protein
MRPLPAALVTPAHCSAFRSIRGLPRNRQPRMRSEVRAIGPQDLHLTPRRPLLPPRTDRFQRTHLARRRQYFRAFPEHAWRISGAKCRELRLACTGRTSAAMASKCGPCTRRHKAARSRRAAAPEQFRRPRTRVARFGRHWIPALPAARIRSIEFARPHTAPPAPSTEPYGLPSSTRPKKSARDPGWRDSVYGPCSVRSHAARNRTTGMYSGGRTLRGMGRSYPGRLDRLCEVAM